MMECRTDDKNTLMAMVRTSISPETKQFVEYLRKKRDELQKDYLWTARDESSRNLQGAAQFITSLVDAIDGARDRLIQIEKAGKETGQAARGTWA